MSDLTAAEKLVNGLSVLPGRERLFVMRQNPDGYFHWTQAVSSEISAAELLQVLARGLAQ